MVQKEVFCFCFFFNSRWEAKLCGNKKLLDKRISFLKEIFVLAIIYMVTESGFSASSLLVFWNWIILVKGVLLVLWEIFSSIPCLYPPDTKSSPSPSCDNWKCLHVLPTLLYEAENAQLRTSWQDNHLLGLL